jgi:hypothetical protein
MRLRWWQYAVGFLVAVLSIAAIVGCFAGLVFLVNAVATGFFSTAIRVSIVRVLLWAGLAVAAMIAFAGLVGMGIDIAESWLWPVPKGTRERP